MRDGGGRDSEQGEVEGRVVDGGEERAGGGAPSEDTGLGAVSRRQPAEGRAPSGDAAGGGRRGPAEASGDQTGWDLSRMNVHRLQQGSPSDEEMPRVHVTRQRALAFAIFVLSVIAFLYFVLPKISGPHGLRSTWHRIALGDAWWVGLAVVF
jgi:hypothetical protein